MYSVQVFRLTPKTVFFVPFETSTWWTMTFPPTRTWTRLCVPQENTTLGKIMFSNDSTRGSNRWHVIRVRSGCQTEVINLSEAFFPITTHYIGHTVPCCLDNCALCDWKPQRGLFYLAVYCLSRTMMLELGAQSSGHLEQHAKLMHHGLRSGQVIRCQRRGQKQPIYTEITDCQQNVTAVAPIDLASKVMALYKLPCSNPGDTIDDYSSRLAGIVRIRNERLALELKKGVSKGL